jgi:hypothetical protein
MGVLDLTCCDIGCWLEVHELCTQDDGDPFYQVRNMVLFHQVNLTEEDRAKLHDLLKVGEHSARSMTRGYILLLASQGKSDDEIAQTLEVGRATVQRVRKRYCHKGLDHALTELPRPGAKPRLDGKQEARKGKRCINFSVGDYSMYNVNTNAHRAE